MSSRGMHTPPSIRDTQLQLIDYARIEVRTHYVHAQHWNIQSEVFKDKIRVSTV